MWLILLFYYMYICKPHPVFHLITGIILLAWNEKFVKMKIQNVTSLLGNLLMFIGFYLNRNIMDFAFLPWWTLCIIGLRDRDVIVLLFGIVVCIYFLFLNWTEIAGHIIMNVGAMLHSNELSLREHSVVHCFMGAVMLFISSDIEFGYKECLAIACGICVSLSTPNPDWFSLSMVYSSVTALPLVILHACTPNWFLYYKNNDYRPVKNTFMWLVPILILAYRYASVLFVDGKFQPSFNV